MNPQMNLYIEKLVSGGLGLARVDGRAILVPGSLPGEQVRVEMPEKNGWPRILEIIEPSPNRIEPDCPWAGRCGGCDFIHVKPEAALPLKAQAALGGLIENLGAAFELVSSPLKEAYRQRATWHLEAVSGRAGLGVGYYDSERRLIEFEKCRLLSPGLETLLGPFRAWAASLPSRDGGGVDVSLTESVGGPERLAVISPSASRPGTQKGKRAVLSKNFLNAAKQSLPNFMPPDLSVFARSGNNSRLAKISFSGPDRAIAAVWPEWGLNLKALPGGFTQINAGVNKLLVEKIISLASSWAPGRALDLYSGLGNLALPLLKSGFQVTAVEDSQEGVAAARENSRGLLGFTQIQGRCETVLPDLVKKGHSFDLITLDPPRAGAQNLAPALSALKPKAIFYVSCHPATLLRDLPGFISLGYKPFAAVAFDMFPRTSHLETLVALQR